MINIVSNGVGRMYGIKHYSADVEADIELLPHNVAAGSTAFCIENSKTYMINSAGKWIEITFGSSTSSGGGSGSGSGSTGGEEDDDEYHIIYDGGEEV